MATRDRYRAWEPLTHYDVDASPESTAASVLDYAPDSGEHRIIPHSAKVRGWMVTPSHVLNNQLDTVWLAE